MEATRKFVRKSWWLGLTILAVWLYARMGELPSIVPNVFSGSMEVPLVFAWHQDEGNAQWKPMDSVAFAGSLVLLHSGWRSQEFYVSKPDGVGWERILFGCELGGGKQIRRNVGAQQRGSHVVVDGLQVAEGSLTALAFVTDNAEQDVVVSPRAIVRHKDKPVGRPIVVSPGLCVGGALFLLLVGTGCGWWSRGGFDLMDSCMARVGAWLIRLSERFDADQEDCDCTEDVEA